MERIKYPSTMYLPWSRTTGGDKVLKNDNHFIGKHVVVTEKMDGENTTIYNGGYCHARSLDSGKHESRNYVKKLAGEIGYKIPHNWRICGENMYAKHSIYYERLESYFLVFSIWDENNECLSWQRTVDVCTELGLKTVPVLYWGEWTKSTKDFISLDERSMEGYVVRFSCGFKFCEFKERLAKYVRPNHVQTSEHWLKQEVVPNKLVTQKHGE